MKANGTSESYQNGNLKILIYFARFLGTDAEYYDISKKEQILAFLNTRIKDPIADPDKRWIRTWNDYLQRIKYFFRWFENCKQKAANGYEVLPNSEWITPVFVQIKEKRTKRLSPYTESELWERDEIVPLKQQIIDSHTERYFRGKCRTNIGDERFNSVLCCPRLDEIVV
jgi:integrase/recombinase XerD